MNKRDQSLDILKGIGIFLMVFDHVGWGSFVHTYIQSFHMPLFFIVSGYLWKNDVLSSLAKKRFKTLMIPYAGFATAFLLLRITPAFGGEQSIIKSLKAVLLYPTDIANMPIAPALWFLPCMFSASIVYSLLSRLDFKLKAFAIVCISTLGMTYSSLFDRMLPFTIEPMTVALGFILVGELIKKNNNNVMEWIDKSWIIIILLIAEAALAILNGSVDMRSARYHNCFLYLFNGIAGTLAYWGIAKKISLFGAQSCVGGVKWISSLSQNAMGFICMNQLFISLFSKAFHALLTEGTLGLIAYKAVIFVAVTVAISWITQMIMNSRVRFVLGGKQ